MDTNYKRWLILLLGFIMMVCAGLIFSWSIFISPIENDLGFSRNSTSLVFTISLSVSILGQIIAGIIANKKSPQLVFGVATVLLVIGFIGSSYVENLYQLYLYYGVFCGMAIGMIYNVVTTVVSSWFPDKIGTTSGVLLTGFGMSGMILGTLSAYIITLVGWRQTFIILAAIFAVITILGVIFMRSPKVAYQEVTVRKKSDINVHPMTMIRQKSFLMFFFWSVFIASTSLLVIGHAALFAEDIGASVKVAALAAGVVSTFNGLSRMVFGKLNDVLGSDVIIKLVTTILGIGAVLILIAYNSNSLTLLFIGFTALGAGYGGNPPLVTAFIKNTYGSDYFGVNLGIANIHMALGSLIGPTIAASIRTSCGSYTPAIFIMIILIGIAFVFSYKISVEKTK